MLVRLSERILLRSGSAATNSEGKLALDKVAGSFKTLSSKSVVVTGLTSNRELSTGRALPVVRHLQSKGVDPRMLGAAGAGESHRSPRTTRTRGSGRAGGSRSSSRRRRSRPRRGVRPAAAPQGSGASRCGAGRSVR
jgi:outer membrane protein OmpA-like peptidoglycan-associated protein